MRRLANACLIAALLSAPAWPQVDFDRGIDTRAILSDLPPAPVPAGMALVLFREDTDGLTLAFQDQRARLYAGGMTRLIIEVKEDRGLRQDPLIFDLDITQPVGPYYEVSFRDVLHKLRQGGRYYAVWSFQRQGPDSTEAVQRGGRSAGLVLTVPRG